MKKNVIAFISFVFIIFLIIGGIIIYKKINPDKNLITHNKNFENNNSKIKNENKEKTGENKENKNGKNIKKQTHNIEEFKEKLQVKGLIVKGDIELKNNEYLFALQKFLKANKKTPNNPKIISKIGQTYFLMKKYDLAYKYFSKIKDSKELPKEMYYLSFLYSKNLQTKNFNYNGSGVLDNSGTLLIDNIKKEFETIITGNPEELFYYKNSLECIKSFHNCKKNFENYFKNTNYSAKNKNLENIRQAIENYKNSQINELYYKNILVIGALFKNKNYPVVIILSKNLLKQKPNYLPILKILAQSYYELNDIENTKKYLREYTKIDTKSPDVAYMLGAIHQKQHNYIQSNIFLDLALKQGYPDKISIYRLKLYNYLVLDQKEKIISTFDKIIALQKNPEFNDLVLSSYYNIINNNLMKALIYIEKGIKLYPKKSDFYGLKAWIFIEQKKYNEAEELLKKATELNPRNAVIALNLGRLEYIRYKNTDKIINKLRAKTYFKKAIELDNAEIGKQAQKFLEELENEENNENKEKKIELK